MSSTPLAATQTNFKSRKPVVYIPLDKSFAAEISDNAAWRN